VKVGDLTIYKGQIVVIVDTEGCDIDRVKVALPNGKIKEVDKTGLVTLSENR